MYKRQALHPRPEGRGFTAILIKHITNLFQNIFLSKKPLTEYFSLIFKPFVAVDDPDGAEWNTEALGKTKRLRAIELFNRMRDKYAPYGLSHFGQGKWYPVSSYHVGR